MYKSILYLEINYFEQFYSMAQQISQSELTTLKKVMEPHNQPYTLLDVIDKSNCEIYKYAELFRQLVTYYQKSAISYHEINEYFLQKSLIHYQQKTIENDLKFKLQDNLTICQGSTYELKKIIPYNNQVLLSNNTQLGMYSIQQNALVNWSVIQANKIIQRITILESVIAYITKQGELYAKALIQFQSKKKIEAKSILLAAGIEGEVLFLEGSKQKDRWFIITKTKVIVTSKLMIPSKLETRQLAIQAQKAIKLNQNIVAIMLNGPCIYLFDTQRLVVVSKIFNDVRYSCLCYNKHYQVLVMADYIGYIMKQTVNFQFNDLEDDGVVYRQGKFTRLQNTLALKKKKDNTFKTLQQTNTKSNFNKILLDQRPNDRLSPYDSEVVNYKDCSTKNSKVLQNLNANVISLIDTYLSSVVTYEQIGKAIKLWNIKTMTVYQVIKNSFSVGKMLVNNSGLFILSAQKHYLGFYPVSKTYAIQEKKLAQTDPQQIKCIQSIKLDRDSLYISTEKTIYKLVLTKGAKIEIFTSRIKRSIKPLLCTNNQVHILESVAVISYNLFGNMEETKIYSNSIFQIINGVYPFSYFARGQKQVFFHGEHGLEFIIKFPQKITKIWSDNQCIGILKGLNFYVMFIKTLTILYIVKNITDQVEILCFSKIYLLYKKGNELTLLNMKLSKVIITLQLPANTQIQDAKIFMQQQNQNSEITVFCLLKNQEHIELIKSSYLDAKYIPVAFQEVKGLFHGKRQFQIKEIVDRSLPRILFQGQAQLKSAKLTPILDNVVILKNKTMKESKGYLLEQAQYRQEMVIGLINENSLSVYTVNNQFKKKLICKVVLQKQSLGTVNFFCNHFFSKNQTMWQDIKDKVQQYAAITNKLYSKKSQLKISQNDDLLTSHKSTDTQFDRMRIQSQKNSKLSNPQFIDRQLRKWHIKTQIQAEQERKSLQKLKQTIKPMKNIFPQSNKNKVLQQLIQKFSYKKNNPQSRRKQSKLSTRKKKQKQKQITQPTRQLDRSKDYIEKVVFPELRKNESLAKIKEKNQIKTVFQYQKTLSLSKFQSHKRAELISEQKRKKLQATIQQKLSTKVQPIRRKLFN